MYDDLSLLEYNNIIIGIYNTTRYHWVIYSLSYIGYVEHYY